MFNWLSRLWLFRSSRRPIRNRRPAAGRTRGYRPGMEILEDRIAPALYIVNALTDDTSGNGGAGNSGDLRYCISLADQNSVPGGSDTILFGVSGLITLNAALPAISDNVSLMAPANSDVIVNGNGFGAVFAVSSDETVNLSGLTITGGSGEPVGGNTSGGGIYNDGALRVNNCTIFGNSAGFGGGIDNEGGMTLNNCTVSSNTATGNGGGIENGANATLALSNCTVSDNSAFNSGGIDNNGTVTVSNCTIFGNSSANNSGGIGNAGTMAVSDCTLNGNTALSSGNAIGNGGAIDNSGTMMVANCTLNGNNAREGSGGGIENGGTMTVSNCTLSGNYSDTGGGAIDSFSILTLSNCTLTGNSGYAVGGGGAILISGGTMAILNSTIARNSNGGIYQFSPSAAVTLHDTIVAGNNGGQGYDGAVSPSVTIGGVTYNEGYNLIGDGAGSTGIINGVNGDQVGTAANPIDPELGPLQDNGGPTQTMALLGNSPAINAGDPNGSAGLPEYDQRGPGFPRLVGIRADIGAYEFQTVIYGAPANLTLVDGSGQSTTAGAPFAGPLQVLVTDSHGNPVPDQLVAFTAPKLGPTGLFTTSPDVMTNAEGIATAPTLTANHLPGSFDVAAAVDGVAAAVDFNLTVTAVPAAITVSGGSGQTTQVYTEFANPLQALVTDVNGRPVAGITVVFEVPISGAGAVAAGPVAVLTNANGIATSPVLIANTTAGSLTVQAAVAGVGKEAEFSLTNTAAAAASVSGLSGLNQSAAIHSAYAAPMRALVVDSFGNPVSGVTVTFTAPTGGASGVFTGKNTAVTAGNGIATAPAFTANGVTGSFNVGLSIFAGSLPLPYFSLTNLATAPAKAKANAGTSQSGAVNTTFGIDLQVLVTNVHGNPVGGAWVTFSAPTSGASGTFDGSASVQTGANGIATAPPLMANTVAGTYRVTANVSGLAGSVSFSLNNLPGSPASLTVAAGNHQSTHGSRFAIPLVVYVTDAYGNAVRGVQVTFTIQSNTATGAGGLFGFDDTAQIKTSPTGHAVAPVLDAFTDPGTFTVDASIGGGVPDAVFTLTIL
jgi:hypothetical protein